MAQFEVDRTEVTQTRVVDEPSRDLARGEARLSIERFGLSANNISYHSLGDLMGYWKLFPATDATGPWRRIPVWGDATVTESTHDDIEVGRRYFGMYPMGDELVVQPSKVRASSFHDATAHRQDVMATVWNNYAELDAPEEERSWDVLLRPLYITGFLVADFLGQSDSFGADTVVLTSASSKTALFSAFYLRAGGGPRVVGMTSAAHAAFVRAAGAYDEVLEYGEIEQLSADTAVLLDYGSNVEVRNAIAARLGQALVRNFTMGIAHAPPLDRLLDTSKLAGPTPETFPAQIAVSTRRQELGGEEYDRLTAAALVAARAWTPEWLTITEHTGMDAVDKVYASLCAGTVPPSVGHVLFPH